MKTAFKIAFVILFVAILAIAGFYGVVRAGIISYNETLRSDKTDEGLTVSISPRGGSADSWVKAFQDGRNLIGKIYEMEVSNTGDCEISDWTERIDITTDCYLNNAWCGTFEIHQFVKGVEKTYTIDLRSYKVNWITLNYQLEGQDLMIPLHAGDYIIYHPSKAVFEEPLIKGGSASVGFILYYETEEPAFSGAVASYHFNKSLAETDGYKALLVALAVWGVAVIVVVSLLIYSGHAEKQLKKSEQSLEESIGIFSGFVDAKDTYTNGHSRRVALYAQKIAEAMGYPSRECRNIYYIGLMHDCGKCFIPDEILKKPGRLTDEEFDVIKSHTVRGAELLEDFKSLANIKEGALYHHERYDGRGYPCKKAGKDIPEVARILCIADSFDAMNSKRVYRDTLTAETILNELHKGRGTQFDPDILDVFLKLIDDGTIIMNKKKESE